MDSGFILINKPVGPTSHDIVDRLRRITKIRKIGHAGTLDPFASGLLIMAIGREATKRISQFVKVDKEYIADLKLGFETDTYDCTGEIIKKYNCQQPSKAELKKILKTFTGKQEQIPPMYSAKKIKGKKLYELARQGKEIERAPNKIEIYKIKLLSYSYPDLKIKIHCSSGTYIRTLAYDIGQALHCGAYLQELLRTKIAKHKLKQAYKLAEITFTNYQQFLF